MRLSIIRHADPIYETDTITAEGEREAAALAQRIAGAGLDRLYASPLGRAQATAAPVAASTGLPVTTLDWTREWGHLQVDTPIGRRCIWDVDGELLHASGLPDHAEMAPSWAALGAASDAFLGELGYAREGHRYRITASSREHVAVVCHGGFGLAWLAYLLGIEPAKAWASFWLPPTSVTTILMDERSATYACPRAICVGDTSHLHAAGRVPLPRGLKANVD